MKEIFTDSSAAKSIAMSFGTSRKTRHIQLKYLFMQDLIRSNIVKLKKVPGDLNPADVLTKHVKLDVLRRHLQRVGLHAARDYTILALHCLHGVTSSAIACCKHSETTLDSFVDCSRCNLTVFPNDYLQQKMDYFYQPYNNVQNVS